MVLLATESLSYRCEKRVDEVSATGTLSDEDEPSYWLTIDGYDVEGESDNPNEERDELPNRISKITVGFASIEYEDYDFNTIFKGVTAV